MNTLYPLKFKPVFKEKIWGGQKIRTQLGMDFTPLPNCGEAWVLSGVIGSETPVKNGFLKNNTLNELLEIYMDELVGEKVFDKFQDEFPILIKFIDSDDFLSVQVHPNDEMAARKGLGNGKSEMWYVLQADENARLYTGFNRDLNRKTYLDFFGKNRLKEILNVENVKADDVFYIPAGRIHAIGPGILLAEIQQSSDTTYRIYDWDRNGQDGKPRVLHTTEALEALDFTFHPSYKTTYPSLKNQTNPVVETPYFSVNQLQFDRPLYKDYSDLDSFVIYLCVEGSAMIGYQTFRTPLNTGEAMLIPAILEEITLHPSSTCKILESYIG